jgi:hypothetical protein
MLVARSSHNENRRTNVGDVSNGFQVMGTDMQTQWYLRH